MARQLKALVGFEIDVSELQGTWKVSQNKAADDKAGVIDGLAAEHTDTASQMAALVKDAD